MNHQEIVKLYALVKKYYPMYEGPTTPEDIKAFYLVMEDVTLEDVMKNLINHVKCEKRYPTVADLRGSIEDKAYDQYQKVLMNEDNKFSGITEEAAQAMRAVGITPASTRDQITKVRNDFMKYYVLEVNRRKDNGICLGLPEKIINNRPGRFSKLPQDFYDELIADGIIRVDGPASLFNATEEQIERLASYGIY